LCDARFRSLELLLELWRQSLLRVQWNGREDRAGEARNKKQRRKTHGAPLRSDSTQSAAFRKRFRDNAQIGGTNRRAARANRKHPRQRAISSPGTLEK
jgi:hypothetical protein